ncbi:hypothetical protein C2862_07340 [Massilia sp. Mn16-1_5]|nr:hypothetical protein C2862_07340 [Massilia sp. Mn16-1_5]
MNSNIAHSGRLGSGDDSVDGGKAEFARERLLQQGRMVPQIGFDYLSKVLFDSAMTPGFPTIIAIPV